jgi:hypothetical protein
VRSVLVAVLAGALALGGCGGDDDRHASYVETVEAACDERDVAINAVLSPVPSEPSDEYVLDSIANSIPVIEEYLDAVRGAGRPGGDLDDEHDEYVQLLEDTLDRYRAAVGDLAKTRAIFDQPAPRFRELEVALGLETCGTIGNGQPSAESS